MSEGKDSPELSVEEKVLIARSSYFINVVLRALVRRNSDVALDLFEYAAHYSDIKRMLEQHIASLRVDGELKLTSPRAGRRGKRRQHRNQQKRRKS